MDAYLRRVRPTDAEPVYRLLSDMDTIRYMLFERHTREQAMAFVCASEPQALGPDRFAIDRAITEAGRDELIGLCGLVIDQPREEAEAWYMMLPEARGRGLATSALRQLLASGFGDFGLHRIWACVAPVNAASCRVLEKAGMRREGHSLRNLRIHGEWMDSYLYAILREEWRPVTST